MEHIRSSTQSPQYPMTSNIFKPIAMATYHPEFDMTPTRGPTVPTSLTKTVVMEYGTHKLRGILFMLETFQYMEYHSRFYGIMSSIQPQLSDPKCEPWVLLNGILGMTWVHGNHLPEGDGTRPNPAASNNTPRLSQAMKDAAAKEPPFIALTDNYELFTSTSDEHVIGRCDSSGVFEHSNVDLCNDLIVALPSLQSFAGTTVRPTFTKSGKESILEIHEYPPLPVDEKLLHVIHKIRAASNDKDTSNRGIVRKQWLKDHIGVKHFDSRGHLSHKSPLFAHRGNEAVFYRDVWSGLCFPLNYDEEKISAHGFLQLPKPYYQVLFTDLSSINQVEGMNGF